MLSSTAEPEHEDSNLRKKKAHCSQTTVLCQSSNTILSKHVDTVLSSKIPVRWRCRQPMLVTVFLVRGPGDPCCDQQPQGADAHGQTPVPIPRAGRVTERSVQAGAVPTPHGGSLTLPLPPFRRLPSGTGRLCAQNNMG